MMESGTVQLDGDRLRWFELIARGVLEGEVPDLPAARPLVLRDPTNIPLATVHEDGRLEVRQLPPHAEFAELRDAKPLEEPGSGIVSRGMPTGDTVNLLLKAPGPHIVLIADTGSEDLRVRVRAWQAVERARDGLQLAVVPWPEGADETAAIRYYGAARAGSEAAGEAEGAGQGLCVWFTGLPSAGKSTIAGELAVLLKERGRKISMLDGDVVRMHLSKGLGFSREDREANIARIAFVAGEVVRHGGVALCAAVSPYESARKRARELGGGERFVLVYVATPAEICEDRDVKGFYAKARAGSMQGFTGVDDPYEPPEHAEVVLGTEGVTAAENAHQVIEYLERAGLLRR